MARRGNQVCAEQRAFFHDTAAFRSTRTMQQAAFAVAPVGDRFEISSAASGWAARRGNRQGAMEARSLPI
jgi:hypothetical protein